MPVSSDINIRERVRREIEANDPPVEIGSTWYCPDIMASVILRRIRILARYPGVPLTEDSDWIYEELPGGKLRMQSYHISRIPEFNLRYVFRPED
jgi:hypothetical protein